MNTTPLTNYQRQRAIQSCLENLTDQLHDGAYDPSDDPIENPGQAMNALYCDLNAVQTLALPDATYETALVVICDTLQLCGRTDSVWVARYIDGK